MNVRFAPEEIRFRVNYEEFDRLCRGENVELETIPLKFSVRSTKNNIDQGMTLDITYSTIHVVIFQEELQELSIRLPSRDGIERTLPLEGERHMRVAFEVDLKNATLGSVSH
jgi:hypothetical protein